jgi:protein SCO1/2
MARIAERGASRTGALALLAALALCACAESDASAGESIARAADDDWTGPELADFRMTASDGREVTLDSLSGAPFVLDFVFTSCTGPCPAMTDSMALLQGELAGSGVRLVSVSVDPETDTLERLAEYGAARGADPERWHFLRGDEQTVVALATSVWLSAARDAGADAGMRVAHSSKFVVVDGQGRVRGYYEGTTSEGRAAAAARARWLAGR